MKEMGFYTDENQLPDSLSAYVVNRKECKKSEVRNAAKKWIEEEFGKSYFETLTMQDISDFVNVSDIIRGYIRYYPRGREDFYRDDESVGVWLECKKAIGAVPVYILDFRK